MTSLLMLFCALGMIRCDTNSDTKNFDQDQPSGALLMEPSRTTSIAVCDPEIAEILVRLGAASEVIAVDTDSLRIAGLTNPTDLGTGCSDLARLSPILAPDAILGLGASQEEPKPSKTSRPMSTARRWDFDPKDLDEIIDVIRRLGVIAEREDRAGIEIAAMTHAIASIAIRRDGRTRKNVVWVIDREPLTVVGAIGLLHDLLELAGAENAFHDSSGPRLVASLEDIRKSSPNVVLLSVGNEDLAKTLQLPVRVIPGNLARVPTLTPVGRVRALHDILYSEDP